jgi:crossover junction endodeoxyribonuclease RuvC
MTFIGIDPGLTGACVFLHEDGSVEFVDTPTIKQGGNAKQVYDRALMATTLRQAAHEMDCHVYIERVHAMPKQGVASSFSFGTGYGVWLGIIAAFQLPHTLVEPARWTKELLRDLPKGDGRSVIRATELYPKEAPHLRTERGRLLHGRADALLLAHYGKIQSERALNDFLINS